ncbi:glycosyltransferase family 4 protein [Roseivivax sp. GX 12232]|uniref:glycosyltransferase family 4 protein n=1 Tax=Roseivivax sp. GX 12232 TaxID=2900547 RepID=UPI001E33C282|nr:glycosyltransferase family 4 protein [Roseivivax sp. GX 12232]MCE0506453.1 glycosyltransferase family 4 protein [Roseivivax sp. GX 12232]
MTLPVILHLVDDTQPGGVTRLLDHIRSHPELAREGLHRIRKVKRGALSHGRCDADVIVSHLTVNWRGLPALMALRALHPATPLVHVEHSYTEGFTALNVPQKGRFLALLRTAYALFDRVVAVSHAQAAWMSARELVAPEALVTIRPTVDLSAFRALPAPQRRARVLGALGRLAPQKGFDILIEAFRAAPELDLELRVIGEGPERARLETLARGDARIRFVGHAADPVAAMGGLDAVAMPSRWEAFGIVASEARAAGRALLAAPVDGLRDHIEDGATAVPNLSIAEWREALRDLATREISALPDCASRRVEKDFVAGWSRLLSGLVTVLEAKAA